jgi:5'-AMP-activated protein kinase catalytic alpha subunit
MGNIKVTDFGLSALAGTAQREALLHTICGTPMFIAPEVFLRCGYDGAKADVWACGVILFALVAGRYPFNHKDTSMYHMIRRCDYHCPPWFSTGLVGLVRRILCPDPVRRIAIPQMKENLWFKKDFKEIPRSLSEPELRDSNSDSDDEAMASSTSSGDPASPIACPMHTSVSAPSLTTLESTGSVAVQAELRMRRPKSLNAFDIIASSPSLDLSRLFQEPSEQMRFVSAAPVSKIISKLRQLHGAHQGVPGEHRGDQKQEPRRAPYLYQDLRTHV